MAQFTKWRKRSYAYDPMQGLRHNDIKRFAANTSDLQPHKQRSYVWRNFSKEYLAFSGLEGTGITGTLEFSGCECNACDAYYQRILELNPARAKAMLGLSYIADEGSEPEHIGEDSDGIEMSALIASFQDIGPITVRCAFVRRVNEKKREFSEQRYIRESRAKSSIKWRG